MSRPTARIVGRLLWIGVLALILLVTVRLGWTIAVEDRPAAALEVNDDLALAQTFAVGASEGVREGEIRLWDITFKLNAAELAPGRTWAGRFEFSGEITKPAAGDALILFLPVDSTVEPEDVLAARLEVTRHDDRLEVRFPLQDGHALDWGIDFRWPALEVRKLGVERAQIAIRYDPTVRLISDIAKRLAASVTGQAEPTVRKWNRLRLGPSGGPSTLVHVEVRLPDPNDRFVGVSPDSNGGGFDARRWDLVNSDDSLQIEIVAENEWSRRQLDLAANVMFLFLGVVIAELPRVIARLTRTIPARPASSD